MHSKTFPAIILMILALVFLTACERGEKGEKDEDEDQKAPSASVNPAQQQPALALPVGKAASYNFDSLGSLPSNFISSRTGGGDLGSWAVLSDTEPSKLNVLAQTSTDSTDYRFPMAILNDGVFKDLELSVRFKAVSGSVDQAGGLVFRYKDENNYYVVRANALEDNYRLYHVINGRRQQFAGANITVTPKQWHELKVVCVGNQITCFFDGNQLIQATDDTFKEAGRVGMWTKADSVTYFDDFTVTPK